MDFVPLPKLANELGLRVNDLEELFVRGTLRASRTIRTGPARLVESSYTSEVRKVLIRAGVLQEVPSPIETLHGQSTEKVATIR